SWPASWGARSWPPANSQGVARASSSHSGNSCFPASAQRSRCSASKAMPQPSLDVWRRSVKVKGAISDRRESGGVPRAACLSRASRFLLSIGLILSSASIAAAARAQVVVDEARQAGRAAQTFPAADEDYFKGMDGGIALSPDEVKGRNMWLV